MRCREARSKMKRVRAALLAAEAQQELLESTESVALAATLEVSRAKLAAKAADLKAVKERLVLSKQSARVLLSKKSKGSTREVLLAQSAEVEGQGAEGAEGAEGTVSRDEAAAQLKKAKEELEKAKGEVGEVGWSQPASQPARTQPRPGSQSEAAGGHNRKRRL